MCGPAEHTITIEEADPVLAFMRAVGDMAKHSVEVGALTPEDVLEAYANLYIQTGMGAFGEGMPPEAVATVLASAVREGCAEYAGAARAAGPGGLRQ
jgi:hypothetical protein